MSPGARALRDVGKGAVAVVVEEVVGRRVVGGDRGPVIRMAVDEDVKVGVAVAVVVEGRGRSARVVERDAGFDADFLEGAVAAVAVQEIRLSEIGHVEIGVTVVVVVERQRAEGLAFLAPDARARRGVFESAVAAVAVQMVAVAAGEEKIGPAVPVEIEHGHARRQVLARDRDVPVGFRQEGTVDVREPGPGRDFLEERGVRPTPRARRPPIPTPSARRRRQRARAAAGAFRLAGAASRSGPGRTGTGRGGSRGARHGAGSRRSSPPRGRARRIRREPPRDGPPARPHRIGRPAGRGTGTRRSTGEGSPGRV